MARTTRVVTGSQLAGQQARQIPAVTQAALELGHEPRVERTGKRFRLACSCGWETSPSLNRKASFAAVTQHVWEVGHQALDTPDPVEIPQEAGGRA
jgi:hypothetical protein